MRIFTVTHRGEPFAILRARDAAEAIDLVRGMEARGRRSHGDGPFAAREPDDAEMIDWLTRPEDRLLIGEDDRVIAPLHAG
jgi:hypothetical protein